MSHLEIILLIGLLLSVLYWLETTSADKKKHEETERTAREFNRDLSKLDARFDKEYAPYL